MRYNVTIAGAFTGRLTSFLGGVVFAKNGIVRAYSTPTNPQTASQQLGRAAFLYLTAQWKVLTPTQRTAWVAARTLDYFQKVDVFTGTSGPYKSAKDLFVGLNYNSLLALGQLGTPAVQYSTPGTAATNDPITAVSVIIDASAQTVIFSFTGAFANEQAIFRMTPAVSPGNMNATSVKSDFRVVTGTSPVSPANISAEYLALFPVLTGKTGEKVFWVLEGVDINTGVSRLIASGNVIIVA